MPAFFISAIRTLGRYLPLLFMAWGVAFGIFVAGFLVGNLHRFPYDILEEARLALVIGWKKVAGRDRIPHVAAVSDLSAADVPKSRIVVKQPVDDASAFLLTGGRGQFLEYCPEHGCAAAIFKRDGSLVHTYPYRPDELTTKRTVDLPYGELWHDDAKDTGVIGLSPLPNGDLIVVYDFEGTVPYGGGVARMDKAGHLLWYRRDYSDHWPMVTPQNEILVISHDIGPTRVPIPENKNRIQTFACASGMLKDIIRVLDFDGQVKDEIPVFDALLASPYWTRLLVRVRVTNANSQAFRCDPIHTNSVVLVGEELAARLNVRPDDLLLSFHQIHALAIISRREHALTHLFVGTFAHQHSAQVVPGGKIVLFDNLGSSPAGGPSRVLIYDPVTGEERTIFPNKHTPPGTSIYSSLFGSVDISDDGTRALFTVSRPGKAYEIRLQDGQILTTFDNVHDVSSLPRFANAPNPVRYFTQFGVYYVSPNLTN